jgi:hypothetical protein
MARAAQTLERGDPWDCRSAVAYKPSSRKTLQRLSGIVADAGALCDPASAQQHFMPRRARDDSGGD